MPTEYDLKGRIISKFGTLAAFSQHVGWSNAKTSNIVRNKSNITLRDANTIISNLGITDAEDIMSLFFYR